MTRTDELVELLRSKGGIAKQSELRAAGFSAGLIASLTANGTISRDYRG